MSITRKFHLFMLCALLAGNVQSQTVQTQPGKRIYEADKTSVADAIAKLKSGNFVAADVDMIGRGGTVEAIPTLKTQFMVREDPLVRATIARVLIKLGDQ